MNIMKHPAVLYGIATVAAFLLSFGLVLPALISAKSDVLVITGFVAIPAALLAVYELANRTYIEIKGTKK